MFQFALDSPLLPFTHHNPALEPLLRLPTPCHSKRETSGTLPVNPQSDRYNKGACAPSRYALTPAKPSAESRPAMYQVALDSP